jgi:drug/metabolite transporter (DMT)-like permease
VPPRISERSRGYLAIVAAAAFFGAWPTLSKLALESIHSPVVLAFLVQLIPAVLLLPTLRHVRIPRADRKLVLFSGVMGSVCGPLIYYLGLERTTASNSVLLSNSEAMFTVLLAYAFLGERATHREYLALGGIAVGAFVVTTELRFGDVRFLEFLIGNVLIVIAAICWASSNTVSSVLLRRMRIVPLLALQFVIGAVCYAPIVALSGAPFEVPLTVLPLLIFLSLSAVFLFSVLFFYAFRTIGAMRTGAILPSSALWGIPLALSLLPNETLSPVQILGGALMVGSLVAFYLLHRPADAAGETLKPSASDGPDSP